MKNNRAKKWVKYFLLAALLLLITGQLLNRLGSYLSSQPTPQVTTTPEPSLLSQINSLRAGVGKPPLTEDPRLNEAAKLKAEDMVNRNYFQHKLAGEDTFVHLRKMVPQGSSWKLSENIAKCQTKDSELVEDWTKSQSHYQAMIADDTLWGSGSAYNPKDGCQYTVNYFVRPL